MMTVEEYLEANGLLCPACKEASVETIAYIELGVHGDGAYQDCKCDACGATWTDVYQLTSFDNFAWGPPDHEEEETYFAHPSLTNGERNPGLAKGQY